jgi:uncharacterized protein (DUF1330 family)
MPAYVIVDIEVNDAPRYEDYKKLAAASVAAHHGRYLARGGATEVLYGEWKPGRLVILEFPSLEEAKAWESSPEYTQAKKIRNQAARTNMVVIESVKSEKKE